MNMSANLDATLPRPRVNMPFLRAFNVTHGPAGLIGRFFVNANHHLEKNGIMLSFADFEEVVQVQKSNTVSWPLMNPMFNPEVSAVNLSQAFCIVGRNTQGRVIATCSGKFLDATSRSFTEIVNSGDFFSVYPDRNVNNYRARMVSDLSDAMHGRLAYSGGLWIHPDARGLKLPAIICRLVTAAMITLWNPDYILGLLDKSLIGTAYHRRYGYQHEEPMLTFTGNGQVLLEAMLLWMTTSETVEDLAQFLDILWPQVDEAVIPRSREHSA